MTLAEITCPVWRSSAPPTTSGSPAVRGILRAAPKADVTSPGSLRATSASSSARRRPRTPGRPPRSGSAGRPGWGQAGGDRADGRRPDRDGYRCDARVAGAARVNAVAEASVSAGKDIVDSAVAVQRTGRAIAAESVRTGTAPAAPRSDPAEHPYLAGQTDVGEQPTCAQEGTLPSRTAC